MDSYTPETYGEHIADVYDDLYPEGDQRAVDALVKLAGGGPALELGIGTGRMALPLQNAGVEVHGVDSSPAMISKLRTKPGGDIIQVTIGSFANHPTEGQFSLIFVVFNTIFGLLTQEEQIQCFSNTARRLKPGGVFVMEAFIPDLARYKSDRTSRSISMEHGKVQIDLASVDLLAQQITSQHVVLKGSESQTYPVINPVCLSFRT